MFLTEKKLAPGVVITLPYQAQSLIKEIWDHQVYNQIYPIRSGDIVFDVGANVGLFSIYAVVRGAAQVYCFEPNPEIFVLLERNIRNNGLQDRISAFNIALGGKNGLVDLFVANTGQIYAEGSASTTPNYVAQLGKNVGSNFTTYQVSCSKLDDILEQLKLPMVDFMKMDCEGAEYEIINSTPAVTLNKIQRMAMETHGTCDSQKNICGLLSTKGYIIDRLVKTTELTLAGYLHCSRSLGDSIGPNESATFPVALVTGNPLSHGFVGETMVFDASASFIPNRPNANPEFCWYIDDQEISDTGSPGVLSYQFQGPGCPKLGLEVRYGDQTDHWEQQLMILAPGYFRETVDIVLDGLLDDTWMSPNKIINLGEGKVCAIRPDVLPQRGFGSVFLAIEAFPASVEGKANLMFIRMYRPWLLLEFNGRKIIINHPYEEIHLENILFDCGVYFTLRPYIYEVDMDINLQWGMPDTASGIQEGNNAMLLPDSGKQSLYRFEGAKSFTIHKDKFPEDWAPKSILLNLRPAQYQGQQCSITGMIIYKESVIPISGRNIEVRLSDIDFEQDLNFTVNLARVNCIRITWWCE